jgi:hypothetical protein
MVGRAVCQAHAGIYSHGSGTANQHGALHDCARARTQTHTPQTRGWPTQSQVKRIASLEYGQWDELDELVTNWAQIANQALVHVLFVRYKLRSHLHAIKQYLLFGQGEFVRHLIDLLTDNFKAGASHLLHHNLTGIVETAVRASYAQVHTRIHTHTCACMFSLAVHSFAAHVRG